MQFTELQAPGEGRAVTVSPGRGKWRRGLWLGGRVQTMDCLGMGSRERALTVGKDEGQLGLWKV